MSEPIFFAAVGSGLARAKHNGTAGWALDTPLKGADIRCLAVDPQNPAAIFAGTQGQGVLRSTDMGATWHPAGLSGQIVKSLAVSPHDPDTIYAGTKPAYMFVSHDGGGTWGELEGFRRVPGRWWWFSPAESPNKAYVQSITLSPQDPAVLLAGIEFGAVVRTSDGGKTWSGHRRGALRDCHTLTFHSQNGKWAYEAGGTGGGASYSQDGGLTWRKAKQGLAKNYGVSCAADPGKPEVWYVSVAPGPGKAYGEQAEAYLYRASGGAEWQPIGWQPHPLNSMPISLLTHPSSSGLIYAGLTNGDVWQSDNYGDTWQQLPFKFKGMRRSLIVLEPNK